MYYNGISTYQFIPCYASAIHTNACIFKPSEDTEPTGLKVDTALSLTEISIDLVKKKTVTQTVTRKNHLTNQSLTM